MKRALIGYTGFVGSNLDRQIKFDYKFNSKNISDLVGLEIDELYCAGVSAVKWFANQNPQIDEEKIEELKNIIKQAKIKKFILISTIDIYDSFGDVNESTIPNKDKQDTYGKNRYLLEEWVKQNYDDCLILRLPALFGKGLKKNFIYDLFNPIPSTIIEEKWEELRQNLTSENFDILKSAYIQNENKNYEFDKSNTQKAKILEILENYGFTALNFTNSNSKFPFYYLNNLKKDIEICFENKIKTLNLSVEPLSCKFIAKEVFDKVVDNNLSKEVNYDFKSIYFDKFSGKDGYLYNKEQTIEFLKEFLKEQN